jgi:hypothetical protein
VAVVMAKQKETSREELARFPQFVPDESFSPHYFDLETGEYHIFPKERGEQIRETLTNYIRPHLQSVTFRGKPTSLDCFLKHAVHALGVYIHQHNLLPDFDRKQAKQTLDDARDAVLAAQQKLQAIMAWPELARFVERIFVQAGKIKIDDGHPLLEQNSKVGEPNIGEPEVLTRKLRLYDEMRDEFRKFSPQTLWDLLFRLEPVLTLAAERVKFQPGDYQRKYYVQEFIDELAFAWICGTGRLPTYSKMSERSHNPSPFAAFLTGVNSVLPECMQSANSFRDYAQKSVKRMKEEFPELPA